MKRRGKAAAQRRVKRHGTKSDLSTVPASSAGTSSGYIAGQRRERLKNAANPPSVMAQIFDARMLRFLGMGMLFFGGLLLVLVAVKKWLKSAKKEEIISPAEFFQKHGSSVLTVLVLTLSVVWICMALRRVLQKRAEAKAKAEAEEEARKSEAERRRRKRPRVPLEIVKYGNASYGIPWSTQEQFTLEVVLDELGVPKSLEEWNMLASKLSSSSGSNVERTGLQCKERFKAISKAFEDQAAKEESAAIVEPERRGNAKSSSLGLEGDRSKAELLNWWLNVGLKKFDNQVAQTYVYNESADTYSYSSDSSQDREETPNSEHNRDPAVLEINPSRRGIEVVFEKLLMWRIGTARLDEVNCQISCIRCGQTRDLELSGSYEDMRVQSHWCSKCKGLLRVALRPAILHENNSIACYMDCSPGVTVVDMLPSTVLVWCFSCGTEIFMPKVQRGRRVEKNCPKCHTKMAFCTQNITLTDLEPEKHRKQTLNRQKNSCSHSQASELKRHGAQGTANPQMVRLIKGEPLPNMGACKHFQKSLRWLRFSCCGKLYPCPVCHEEIGGCILGSIANTMVCGKCSHEQPCISGPCINCSFKMGKGRSNAHWQGGAGSRNTLTMSKKDRKKRQGSSKKTTSNKSSRVGLAGKRNREKQTEKSKSKQKSNK